MGAKQQFEHRCACCGYIYADEVPDECSICGMASSTFEEIMK